MHESLWLYKWGPSKPDLKWIICQHSLHMLWQKSETVNSCTVETTQSSGFNLPIPNTACCISNERTASASQSVTVIWTEVKERPEVTRDGNHWTVARLKMSTFPLLQPVSFGCIVWQPVHFRQMGLTAWSLNGPPQTYDQNCSCVSAFTVFPICLQRWQNYKTFTWDKNSKQDFTRVMSSKQNLCHEQ